MPLSAEWLVLAWRDLALAPPAPGPYRCAVVFICVGIWRRAWYGFIGTSCQGFLSDVMALVAKAPDFGHVPSPLKTQF